MLSTEGLKKASVYEVLERIENQMAQGMCCICNTKCFGSICVKCEGLHDGINRFFTIYPLIQKQEALKRAAVSANGREKNEIYNEITQLSAEIDNRAEQYNYSLLPLDCYNQDEKNLYESNFNKAYAALTEFLDFRDKLFNNIKFQFRVSHCYDTLRYNMRTILEYCK